MQPADLILILAKDKLIKTMSDFPVQEYKDQQSKVVPLGKLMIGGRHPVVIQSMTTTRTSDSDATVRQVMQLADTGCAVVRMAVQNINEARNLENIKSILIQKGYELPLVADVHFNPDVAGIAARYVEKVRVNPGNFNGNDQTRSEYSHKQYLSELQKTERKLVPLLDVCKENNTAIRIGVNHGSLSNRILTRYGNTPEGMVESAMEFIRICRQHGFEQLTLSLKASDVRIMIKANKLLVEQMIEEGSYYPVHLGVTEAGAGIDGRIKSAAGIGHLLMLGVGDTVRVSLTEDPLNEIPVARKLVEFYGKKELPEVHAEKIIFKEEKKLTEIHSLKSPYVVSQGISAISDLSINRREVLYEGRKIMEFDKIDFTDSVKPEQPSILKLIYSVDQDTVRLRAAAEFSFLYDVYPLNGICVHNKTTSIDANAQLALDILQALGLRYSKAEFVACPSCGRSCFDIQDHLEKVRKKTAQLKGLKIAVMGCIVNGPGEMAGADYGYVGSGKGIIDLYKGTLLVRKNLDESLAVDALIELIKENGDWQEEK